MTHAILSALWALLLCIGLCMAVPMLLTAIDQLRR